ncbi:MAG TPA: TMEM175 family protein [Gaiellales bacterium]|jgi:uncharacterized membrane protein|nr:TMEM175 family protein [Gaiellales bacterium]
METGRLEAFSDGVFAIAVTLLVLDVKVPETSGSLGHALAHQWPVYASYAVSFLTVGIMWVNHHVMLRHFDHADRPFLLINVLFLMAISFVPFPTSVVSAYFRESQSATTAAVAYGLTMVVVALMFNLVWRYGTHDGRLLRDGYDRREVSGISRTYLLGPVMYGVATLAALASAYLSLALFAALALFWAFSSAVFGRDEEEPLTP